MDEEAILGELEAFLGVHGHWITHAFEACVFMLIMICIIVLMTILTGGTMRREIDYMIANPKTVSVINLIVFFILIICGHFFRNQTP